MATTDILTYWTGFTTDDEYTDFEDYPESILQESVKYFGGVMEMVGAQSMATWNTEVILAALTAIIEQADRDDDEDATGMMLITYDVVSAYLRYLAHLRKINVTFDALEAALIIFEEQNGLQGPVLDPKHFLKDSMSQPSSDLPEWRDYVARDIRNYTDIWLEAYHQSPAWRKRPKGVKFDLLETVVEVLVEHAYAEYRKTPKSWTKRAITGVLTGYLVSNVNLEIDEYDLVAPALVAFIAFVSQKGWLNAKRASDYQRFITAAAPVMIEQAHDRTNFGPAKLLGEKLLKSDVDLQDREAVQSFIDQVNANGGLDSLFDDETLDWQDEFDDSEPEVDSIDDLTALVDDPEKMAQVAAVYDPDPKQEYLQSPHWSEAGGWRIKKAIKTHKTGVTAGLQLWLKRDNYPVPVGWQVWQVIQEVVDIVDVLYAQHLVDPAEWSNTIWREFGQWNRDHKSKAEYQEARTLITSLLGILAETGELTERQGKQLPAAFENAPIPVVKNTKKVKGKVRSMKQARKLLKNKRHH